MGFKRPLHNPFKVGGVWYALQITYKSSAFAPCLCMTYTQACIVTAACWHMCIFALSSVFSQPSYITTNKYLYTQEQALAAPEEKRHPLGRSVSIAIGLLFSADSFLPFATQLDCSTCLQLVTAITWSYTTLERLINTNPTWILLLTLRGLANSLNLHCQS